MALWMSQMEPLELSTWHTASQATKVVDAQPCRLYEPKLDTTAENLRVVEIMSVTVVPHSLKYLRVLPPVIDLHPCSWNTDACHVWFFRLPLGHHRWDISRVVNFGGMNPKACPESPRISFYLPCSINYSLPMLKQHLVTRDFLPAVSSPAPSLFSI